MENTTATITDCVMSGNLAHVGGVLGGVAKGFHSKLYYV